jgi:hypothetical protein
MAFADVYPQTQRGNAFRYLLFLDYRVVVLFWFDCPNICTLDFLVFQNVLGRFNSRTMDFWTAQNTIWNWLYLELIASAELYFLIL